MKLNLVSNQHKPSNGKSIHSRFKNLSRTSRIRVKTHTLQLTEFWNEYANHFQHLNLSPVYQDLMNHVLAKTDVVQGMSCLDIGCGTGNYSIALNALGARVIGVDSSSRMLELARENVKKTGQNNTTAEIQLIESDAFEFVKKLESNILDRVVANLSIAYMPHPKLILCELHRALKPGGKLVMSNPIPNPNFTWVLIKSGTKAIRLFGRALAILKCAKQIEKYNEDGVFYFFSFQEIEELLKASGFFPSSIVTARSFAGQAFVTVCSKP